MKYKSFFTSVLPLTENARLMAFASGCVVTRLLIFIILFLTATYLPVIILLIVLNFIYFLVSLSYFAIRDDEYKSWWWKGKFNLYYRLGLTFLIFILSLVLVGIRNSYEGETLQKVIAVFIILDLFKGIFHLLYHYFIQKED